MQGGGPGKRMVRACGKKRGKGEGEGEGIAEGGWQAEGSAPQGGAEWQATPWARHVGCVRVPAVREGAAPGGRAKKQSRHKEAERREAKLQGQTTGHTKAVLR